MEYTIEDLIGMLNLALIIANDQQKDMISIPKEAGLELVIHMEDLKTLTTVINEN